MELEGGLAWGWGPPFSPGRSGTLGGSRVDTELFLTEFFNFDIDIVTFTDTLRSKLSVNEDLYQQTSQFQLCFQPLNQSFKSFV